MGPASKLLGEAEYASILLMHRALLRGAALTRTASSGLAGMPCIVSWHLLLPCLTPLHLQAGGGTAAPASCCSHAVLGLSTEQCVLHESQAWGVAPG